MPSMRSIGFTDSRMMASSFSTSRRRSADSARLGRQHVLRLVHQAHAPRLRSRRGSRRQRLDLVGVGLGLGLRAHRRAAVGAGVLLGLAAEVSRSASRSASCAAPISSIGFLRSAISISRAVNTFSSADTAFARADSAAPAPRSAPCSRAPSRSRAAARPARAPGGARSRPPAPRAPCCDALLLDALLLTDARRLDRLLGGDLRALGLLLRCARSGATSARWRARAISSSRCCVRRAYSLSRSMSSDSFSASRFLLRIWISVSCSMSLRFFLRCSICSVSRVRPSASKALLGLKNSIAVWSSCVSDADSSSRPFLAGRRPPRRARAGRSRRASRAAPPWSSRPPRCAARRRTCPRPAPSAARARSVRWPSVCAAAAIASGSASTRT